MSDRLWRSALVFLLTAVLITQWAFGWIERREAAARLQVLRSIESLMKEQKQSNDDIIASLDDIADVLDDVHSHVAGDQSDGN